MPHFEIKHRETGAVIYSGDASTLRALVERAVSEGADLRRANLTGADLSDANLYGADLTGAYLADANLYGAILGAIGVNVAPNGSNVTAPKEGVRNYAMLR